jgi:carbonic anhydrase
MKRAHLIFGLIIAGTALGLVALNPPARASGEGKIAWSYEGATGPQNWGALSEDYALCGTGKQQSPIDLTVAVPAAVAPPLLDWQPFQPSAITHDGHALSVSVPEGSGGLQMGQTRFELINLHFHGPSEHTINGQPYPLEAHFVHRAADGRLAVLGVLFVEGDEHSVLEQLWQVAPPARGEVAPEMMLDVARLLPNGTDAFHYAGSLTTPPCSEIVSWTVLATPVSASARQLAAYAAVFRHNARPVQPRERRFILATN